jgi:hypothetical protein
MAGRILANHRALGVLMMRQKDSMLDNQLKHVRYNRGGSDMHFVLVQLAFGPTSRNYLS